MRRVFGLTLQIKLLGTCVLLSACSQVLDLRSVEFSSTNPATITVVSGDEQTAAVGAALSTPVVVQANDSTGNPLKGAVLIASAEAGSGSVLQTTLVTDDNGQLSIAWTLGYNSTTQQTINIVSEGDSKISASAKATATPNTPASIGVSGGVPVATVGQTLALSQSIQVSDSDGNPVSGITVNISAGSGGGSLPNGGTSVTTDGTGTASVVLNWTMGTTVTKNTLVLTGTGTADGITGEIGITPRAGAVDHLDFITAITSENKFSDVSKLTTFTVGVYDQYNNLITHEQNTINLAVHSSSATILSGGTEVTSNGIATFDRVIVNGGGTTGAKHYEQNVVLKATHFKSTVADKVSATSFNLYPSHIKRARDLIVEHAPHARVDLTVSPVVYYQPYGQVQSDLQTQKMLVAAEGILFLADYYTTFGSNDTAVYNKIVSLADYIVSLQDTNVTGGYSVDFAGGIKEQVNTRSNSQHYYQSYENLVAGKALLRAFDITSVASYQTATSAIKDFVKDMQSLQDDAFIENTTNTAGGFGRFLSRDPGNLATIGIDHDMHVRDLRGIDFLMDFRARGAVCGGGCPADTQTMVNEALEFLVDGDGDDTGAEGAPAIMDSNAKGLANGFERYDPPAAASATTHWEKVDHTGADGNYIRGQSVAEGLAGLYAVYGLDTGFTTSSGNTRTVEALYDTYQGFTGDNGYNPLVAWSWDIDFASSDDAVQEWYNTSSFGLLLEIRKAKDAKVASTHCKDSVDTYLDILDPNDKFGYFITGHAGVVSEYTDLMTLSRNGRGLIKAFPYE